VASRPSPAHDLEQLALGCRDRHGRGVDATAVDVRIDGMAARRDAGDGDGAIWATPEGTWLAPAKDEPHLADTALYGRLSLSKCFVVWAVTSDPTGRSFGLAAG
jgi:hypothetical protein